ncbi:MAG: response regulator [bacterium]|nr:response regulator [bacterium]
MNKKLGLLICNTYKRELEAVVAAEGWDDVHIAGFSSQCGRPGRKWETVASTIKECPDCSRILILSSCFKKNTKAPAEEKVQCDIIHMSQCFCMFANQGIIEEYQRDGAYLVSPGWLARWPHWMEIWGFDRPMAREFFGESAKYILLPDTGVYTASGEALREFADFVGLPSRSVPVGLDYFKLFLSKLVLEWRREHKETPATAAGNSNLPASDYAMAMDLLNRLVQTFSEEDVVSGMIELFTMLFAPRGICYLTYREGRPGDILVCSTSSNGQEPKDAARKRLDALSGNYAPTESATGFFLRISHREETLGILELTDFAFPQYQEQYLNLGVAMASVCGLAISNARSYRKLSLHSEEMAALNTSLEDRVRQRTRQLAAGEARYRTLIESSHEVIFSKDINGRYLMVNLEAVAALGGRSTKDIEGKTDYDLMPAEEADALRRTDEEAMEVDRYIDVEEVIRNVRGEYRTYLSRKWPTYDDNGKINGIACFAMDISKSKQAEEALHKSEEQFRRFAMASTSGFGMSTLSGQIIFANTAILRILEEDSIETFTGKSFLQFYSPENAERLTREILPTVMETGRWRGELPFLTAKDNIVNAEQNIFVIPDEQGNPVMLGNIITDITERKQMEAERKSLEEQFHQAQKMDSVGQLAGGVAHDFNNLLQVIMGFSEMEMATNIKSGSISKNLTQVMQACNRAVTLVRQLLTLSRKQEPELADVNPAEVVNDLHKMIHRVIGDHIAFKIDSEPNPKSIRADKGQIEQVLLNLCINARDAMPGGGTLTIETTNTEPDPRLLEGNPRAKHGQYVMLTVTDTGCGMDEQTQKRIFEPFFTTKGLGNGTGLGLSTVFGIIRQHNGIIQVSSAVGAGTVFTILLPADVEPQKTKLEIGPAPSSGGTETILLADGNDGVREVAKVMLSNAGYTLLTADNGQEAIRIFERHADQIDLALLDVVMPKLSGKAAAKYIIRRRPQTCILFAGGGTAPIMDDPGMKKNTQFIRKPFLSDALLRRVRHMLDGKHPAPKDEAPCQPNLDKKKSNKILLVDDDLVNMELLREKFENAGFNNLLSAVNGEQAIEMALEHHPDLILMDSYMPVMDGNHTIALLKKKGYKGPIIAVSGAAEEEEVAKALESGAVEFIAKPIDFSTFFTRICAYLKEKSGDTH